MDEQPVIDHRAFLKSLSPEQRRELTETSDLAGLFHLTAHLGLIVGFGWLIALEISISGIPVWPVLLLPQGVLIIFLFTLLHETTHRTPFKSVFLNDLGGWIAGLAVVLPPTWFQQFHLAHHRYTQDPDKDPELADGGDPSSLGRMIWRVTGVPIWISHIRTVIRNAAGLCQDSFVPEIKQGAVQREALLMLVIYGALILGSILLASDLLFWTFVIPAALGQPFLRLYLMAEHGRCPYVANMFENTQTTFTNQIVRFVAWNMPFHTEHHAYPTVPFYKLPALHRLMRPHLQQIEENGYSSYHYGFVASLAKPQKTPS